MTPIAPILLRLRSRHDTPLRAPSYLAHVHDFPHRLAAVLRAIAAADGGAILFHCGAGWDRTGLLAAVLLRALDVTDDAAVEDYLESLTNAETMAALHGRSFDVEERLQVLARFSHTPESAFRSMYEELDLEDWFRMAAIDDETRTAVTSWRGAANPGD
ncbi:tyrosine-protein phosphatase [Leifsonia flava]|uniref:tyrosine-protein phosphatase n=1 Tax=Orlajensenia leifsoniae TaxID=2561933 RepID=UPI0023D8FF28|nr:tyrosine-protein phosphatase [Leifsonia flava]